MKYAFRIIDAFADRPFTGNPAAVVLLENWPDDTWLQNVAMEMNLAETAFLVPQTTGYALRWFTPKIEVDLCGHATLASAASLVEDGKLTEGQTVEFATRSGTLRVSCQADMFHMDFPLVAAQACTPPEGLISSLGVAPVAVLRNRFDYLVEVASADEVRRAQPNFTSLANVQCRGVIVTATEQGGPYDFISRFFAPAAGITEDPVTGSAHCCLADYWATKLGKQQLIAYQASPRGGIVQMRLDGPRVWLAGKARVFSRGEFEI